ncbi:MAG: SpoIIE family protein phosphatase [Bacteroidales bacterium]|nr:SpoIIE family protein phosphatase [Bacteroidales bacterium]
MGKLIKSFSGRLIRIIMAIFLVSMAVASLLAFVVTTTGVYSSMKEHYVDAIGYISRYITSNLEKVEISAVNVADEVQWYINSPDDIIKTLASEIEMNKNLTGCGIGFIPDYYPSKGKWFEPYAQIIDGKPHVADIGSSQHDYHNSEWFVSGLASKGGSWTSPYLDKEGAGTLLCTYTLPITDTKGVLAGVFGADISLEWLANILHDIDVNENEIGFLPSGLSSLDQGIYSFILGPEGEYIAHPDKERYLGKHNFFEYAEPGKSDKYTKLGKAMCAGKSGDEIVRMDGRKYSVFYASVSDTGWSMAIAVPVRSLLGPALVLGSLILILMLIGLLSVYTICSRAIRRFTKPLVQLAGSATEVAHGKFDTKLPEISSEDEIRLLRDSFDNMQHSLSKYIADLTETTAQKASMENELDVARNIQMSMLPMTWPAFPDRDDIDIWGGVTPAKAVGGDLFDFCLRENKLFFCIGDVSGKGVPASLVMAVISSMFRTLSASGYAPDKLISVINDSVSDRNDNLMFVTFFVGELDLQTGDLKYCNAGHNAPVVLKDGVPKMLEADANIPVGVKSGWNYSLQQTKLPSGSSLFLYTDGLTEATRADGTLFGEERIFSSLASLKASSSSRDISEYMKSKVREFVGEAEQSDDLTILVIKALYTNK